MNRFLELPLPQRIMVVGVALGLLGFASYYLLLMPLGDEIAAQERRYRNAMAEYAKLKEFDAPEFREQMARERAEALRKKVEFEKMLPREEEIPALIASMKADADAVGIVLTRFEPLKQRIEGEGYRGVQFVVEVAGTFEQILRFMEALAAPSKRVVNLKDIRLEAVPASSMEAVAGDVGLLRVLREREKRRGLTPQEQYAKTVLLFEEAAKQTLLKGVFTAVAYVYTGGAQAQGGQ